MLRTYLGQQVVTGPAPFQSAPPPIEPVRAPQAAPTQQPVGKQLPFIPAFNMPHWARVGLGGTLVGVGVISMFTSPSGSGYTTRDENGMPMEVAPSKGVFDRLAEGGSVVGGLYILAEALGYKI